jgi:tRNA nucleotidyltransferase/poly(A) polymerase
MAEHLVFVLDVQGDSMHEYIIAKLCDSGCKAYLTGGAVRDLFLGQEPYDYDVVTEAVPEQIEAIFSGHEVNTVGASFEVCLVDGIEVAGYRKDTYFGLSDKNCEIEPAETLEEDLARRDLTINAMAFCPYTGELIDPFGGREDLENKVIRFVGNPYERLYEDPCRIIRACRFAAKIGGSFEAETFQALQDKVYWIKHCVAPERIRLELLKAMRIKKASRFFDALDAIGALKYVLSSLSLCHVDGGPYHGETVYEHCMLVGDAISTKCPMTKLAGYLHDVGKPLSANPDGSFTGHEKVGSVLVHNDLADLKFSTKERERVVNLTYFHMRSLKDAKGKGIRKLLRRLKDANVPYREWLRLKLADRAGNKAKENYTLEKRREFLTKLESEFFAGPSAFSIKDLKISGNDVMEILQIGPGPKVGNALKYLYEAVLVYPELNTEERLPQVLKNWRMLYAFDSPRTQ